MTYQKKYDDRPINTYLIKSIDLYKLGQSVNPEKRFKDIKTGNPHAELLCYGRNYTEKRLHKLFKRYRVTGEWFKLPDKAVEWLLDNMNDKHLISNKQIDLRLSKVKIPDRVIDYVMSMGRYYGVAIVDMVSEEQLRYLRQIFTAHYKHHDDADIWKWWYFNVTGRKEHQLNFNTALI